MTPTIAMLTEDGKHLYVSWDEYHMLIEKLALKMHQSGWEFDRSCAWRAAACGRATCCRASSTSRWRSCRPAPTAPRPARCRAGSTWPSTSPCRKGELAGRVLLVDDLADSGVTLRAVVDRLRGMPSITELRWAVIWTKGVSTLHARLLRRAAADEPVDPSAVRGVRRPAPRRTGEEVRHLKPGSPRSERAEQATRSPPKRAGLRSDFSITWCPGRDSNPHGVTR